MWTSSSRFSSGSGSASRSSRSAASAASTSTPRRCRTCHFVDETFDTGDLVEVVRFPIDQRAETAFSLDLRSQERLLELFQRVMAKALAGEELPHERQGEGRYVDRDEFESLRIVRPGDDLDRKLRAFWYPPYSGAVLEVDGRHVTLVDERLLAEVAEAYRDAGRIP
jgi:methionyl-tRNA formyltransferase